MTGTSRRESGQATPLYITAVVGLLFLALVFFAFGQADVTRNGAQSAADAAALAAARESRDQFEDEFLANILTPGYLDDIFGGDFIGRVYGCNAASHYATRNEAELLGCDPTADGRWAFTVKVRSKESMGTSIIEGTDEKHAETTATAVVEPLCTFEAAEQDDNPDDGGDGDAGEGNAGPVSPGELVCDGGRWDIDPGNLDLLPDMSDLFTVRLAED
ncbi:pilus assembly protein TadG-related protein [Streptomyces sp. NRRL S-118]|uniref:pilus assembly protein TadG-related protein n=1 Tax=Streptomyces sp. NRRL S-118 TaxID=1463881 RepID=UPI0004C66437|nr:pilus assembly protein TadG-related protein [Streptomyces sp. NRRL S-118]